MKKFLVAALVFVLKSTIQTLVGLGAIFGIVFLVLVCIEFQKELKHQRAKDREATILKSEAAVDASVCLDWDKCSRELQEAMDAVDNESQVEQLKLPSVQFWDNKTFELDLECYRIFAEGNSWNYGAQLRQKGASDLDVRAFDQHDEEFWTSASDRIERVKAAYERLKK